MCGMKIVSVGTDAKGNINIEELRQAAEKHKDNLSALMVMVLSCNQTFSPHSQGSRVYWIGKLEPLLPALMKISIHRSHIRQLMESMKKVSMRFVR